MKNNNKFIIALCFFLSTTANAAWNARCLADCFSTGHECNYCDYQCEVSDTLRRERLNTVEYECPFTGVTSY